MKFKEVLEKRRSIRNFKNTEISDKTINEILSLAQLAPSAGNKQAYKVKIVTLKEDKEKLRQSTMSKQDSLVAAPVVLAVLADTGESASQYGERGKNLYAIQDATIFASYLQLVITSHGFDSVWVGGFIDDELKKALNLPDGLVPVAMIPFGLSGGEPRPRERKNLKNIILD